jgi:hypothetical protein
MSDGRSICLSSGAAPESSSDTRSVLTRRYTHNIGDPVEIEINYWRREVVATFIRPRMGPGATEQEENVDDALITLYRPEES